jgi:probable rRNA maturation factor
MKLSIEINNLTKNRLDKKFIIFVARETIKKSKINFLLKKNISLGLAIVGKREIKKLNRRYRKINKVTDILSFAFYKNIKEIKKVREKTIFLGELILCYDDIKNYAGKKGINLREELARVISHGILHLLGVKHGKIMFVIQNIIASEYLE